MKLDVYFLSGQLAGQDFGEIMETSASVSTIPSISILFTSILSFGLWSSIEVSQNICFWLPALEAPCLSTLYLRIEGSEDSFIFRYQSTDMDIQSESFINDRHWTSRGL